MNVGLEPLSLNEGPVGGSKVLYEQVRALGKDLSVGTGNVVKSLTTELIYQISRCRWIAADSKGAFVLLLTPWPYDVEYRFDLNCTPFPLEDRIAVHAIRDAYSIACSTFRANRI